MTAVSYSDLGKHSLALEKSHKMFLRKGRELEEHPDTLSSKFNVSNSYGKLDKR